MNKLINTRYFTYGKNHKPLAIRDIHNVTTIKTTRPLLFVTVYKVTRINIQGALVFIAANLERHNKNRNSSHSKTQSEKLSNACHEYSKKYLVKYFESVYDTIEQLMIQSKANQIKQVSASIITKSPKKRRQEFNGK